MGGEIMIPIFFSSYFPSYTSFNIVLKEVSVSLHPGVYGTEDVEEDNVIGRLSFFITLPSSAGGYILFFEPLWGEANL